MLCRTPIALPLTNTNELLTNINDQLAEITKSLLNNPTIKGS